MGGSIKGELKFRFQWTSSPLRRLTQITVVLLFLLQQIDETVTSVSFEDNTTLDEWRD